MKVHQIAAEIKRRNISSYKSAQELITKSIEGFTLTVEQSTKLQALYLRLAREFGVDLDNDDPTIGEPMFYNCYSLKTTYKTNILTKENFNKEYVLQMRKVKPENLGSTFDRDTLLRLDDGTGMTVEEYSRFANFKEKITFADERESSTPNSQFINRENITGADFDQLILSHKDSGVFLNVALDAQNMNFDEWKSLAKFIRPVTINGLSVEGIYVREESSCLIHFTPGGVSVSYNVGSRCKDLEKFTQRLSDSMSEFMNVTLELDHNLLMQAPKYDGIGDYMPPEGKYDEGVLGDNADSENHFGDF